MSRFKDHSTIYDRIICLSDKDQQAPIGFIKDFFADFRLSELRDIQDQILRVCLTSNEGTFDQPEARSSLLSYNEKLIRLLEVAFYLKDSFVPLAYELKADALPKKAVQGRKFDNRVSDLVKGINDVSVDVAHLCVIIVKAWTEKICAEAKIRVHQNDKSVLPAAMQPLDLDKLQTMALLLQGKLAKLAGIAVDILVSEFSIQSIIPQS